LFEETLKVCAKFSEAENTSDEVRESLKLLGMNVLINKLMDLVRAKKFADECLNDAVWLKLRDAQRKQELVVEACQRAPMSA
jgi:hypothetical protein